MKIGVFAVRDLNNSKDLPKFRQAAYKLSIDIDFYNPKDICIKVINNNVSISKKDGNRVLLDGAVNWIPYAKYDEISLCFEAMKIPFINNIDAVRRCRNKVLTNLALAKYKFNQPQSLYYPHMITSNDIEPNISYPFIYKKKNGSHGIGSQKFNSPIDLNNLLMERFPKDSLYFQEYIKNRGYDYRILVVGDKVVGGIKKYYKVGEWRTHVAHGGSIEYFDVPDKMKSICINILKALNLDFAGIDIMPDTEGLNYILEVNSVPGMSIFYNLTDINLAEEILLHLKSLINLSAQNN